MDDRGIWELAYICRKGLAKPSDRRLSKENHEQGSKKNEDNRNVILVRTVTKNMKINMETDVAIQKRHARMEDNRGKRCTKYQQQDRDDQPRP
jgi:hypothetical protein